MFELLLSLIPEHRFPPLLGTTVKKHGYDIHPIKQTLLLEGTEGFFILYLGYIAATLRITPIKDYDGCVAMLILKSSSPYRLRVPIHLGTTVLHKTMATIIVEELANASGTWQQTYMSNMATTAKVVSTAEMKDDGLPKINAPLVTMKSIVIPPFECK